MINKRYYILLNSLLLILAALCVYLQPMASDDFLYSFMHKSSCRITTFSDAIESANSFYMYWNGRYFPNLFDHISLCLLPHWVMFIIAFVVLSATIVYLNKLIGGVCVPLLFCVYWALNPNIEDCIYWNTGFFNYAMPGGCCLAVLYYYLYGKHTNISSCICLFIFSMFAALQQEGISLPLAGALFFHILTNKNWQKLSRFQICIILGFWIGTILCACAPGTAYRVGGAASSSAMNISFYVSTALYSVLSTSLTWILLIVLFVRKKQIIFKEYFLEHEVIILTIILGFFLFIALSILAEVPAQRYFYFIHLFSIVLLYEQINEMSWARSKVCSILFSLISISLVGNSMINQYQKNKIVSEELFLMQNTADGVVPIDISYLTSDTSCWINKTMCDYFHKDMLIAYPSLLYYGGYINDCECKNKRIDGWCEFGNQYLIPWESPDFPVIEWGKVIDVPVVRQRVFVSNPKADLFTSKSGKRYLLLTNGKSLTKVVYIKIK